MKGTPIVDSTTILPRGEIHLSKRHTPVGGKTDFAATSVKLDATAHLGRIGVIEIKSDTLRLDTFERLGASLLPLVNEEVTCGLGRNVARTERLNPEGVELAFASLRHFVALARALRVDHLAIIATEAVREAADGRAFAEEAERQCGVPVRIIEGDVEARLSAAGVLAGIGDADGVVGDLGDSSVKLVRVDSAASVPIGTGVSLPLGPLRLDNRKAIEETIDRSLADAPVLREAAGKSLYLVGDAWQAIARLHMEQTHYPLHIIHEYTIARRPAEGFLDIIAGQSRRSLERITSISRRRLDVVPIAVAILRRLIAAGRPERIVFSAFGLREGYADGLLPPDPRIPPLIAACMGMAANLSRGRSDRDRLQRWTAPIFPDLDEDERRLHRAAAWLSDIAWTEHPDYRAEHAFTRGLRMPVAQIGHRERVFIATALHARYGGTTDDPIKAATRPLLDDAAMGEARCLGLALRLAYTLCGDALELLDQVRLTREDSTLGLELPPTGNLFTSEAVQHRLDTLGRAFGLATRTVRRVARSSA